MIPTRNSAHFDANVHMKRIRFLIFVEHCFGSSLTPLRFLSPGFVSMGPIVLLRFLMFQFFFPVSATVIAFLSRCRTFSRDVS
ncbi:hypothetical protein EDB86DRAFT_2910111 [Lactarius hatsudake]|nr:hypothetical protein EDB86DRAFT_2910111 [Lactarius hatsudake]